MPTSVAPGQHFETFIREHLQSSRFNNASEVVRARLRLLEEYQQRHQIQLQTLCADIAAGKTSGTSKPADAVFSRLEAKYSSPTVDEPRD